MHQLSFQYHFEAAHRFIKVNDCQCTTPHGHTWKAKLIFESIENTPLNDLDKCEEFSTLKTKFRQFIQDTVDHSFFYNFNDPILGSLKKHIPNFRGLPFPGDPTTELIAGLFLEKANKMHESLFIDRKPSVKPLAMEVIETPTNTVIFSQKDGSFLTQQPQYQSFSGWWTSDNPEVRHFKELSASPSKARK